MMEENNLFVLWLYNIMMETRPDAIIRAPKNNKGRLSFLYRKGIDLCMVSGSLEQSGVTLLDATSKTYEINPDLLRSYQTNIKLLKTCGGIDSNIKLISSAEIDELN